MKPIDVLFDQDTVVRPLNKIEHLAGGVCDPYEGEEQEADAPRTRLVGQVAVG